MIPPVLGIFLAVTLAFTASAATPEEEFAKDIRPLVEKYCYDCHGAEKQKADLNLAQFSDLASVTNAAGTWQNVLERVQAFEMPPKKSGELAFDHQQKLVGWLRKLPRDASPDCHQLASDRTANFYRGYVMSRRLNRAEYLNTLRDLLGVPVDVGGLLPADGGGGEGFDTSGNALFVSPVHLEHYLEAARSTLESVLPERTRGLSPEARAARERLLGPRPGAKLAPREAARAALHEFTRRAFRRPVADEELERLLALYDRGRARRDSHVASLRLAFQGVLISPHFLFLAEPEPSGGGVHPLGDVPLASKLSYFIWASMPDEPLLALAEAGRLSDTNILRGEIRRLLADPKAAALGQRFALQWLDLDRLGGEVRPDPSRFPEFSPALAEDMRAEVVTTFNHIFRENRSLLELIDSRYTFASSNLARLYGFEDVTSPTPVQIALKDRARGGILGMAAVHALTSYPTRTSPVLRGKWIMESILGDKVPPPPPNVPPLAEEGGQTAPVSLRKQLEIHRQNAECAACHDKMDPLGFGLENFDVLGRWRDRDRGEPIDARGTMPAGESFEGPLGLKSYLLSRKDKVIRHLARKMTGFAFGRELNKLDDCVIDRALGALEAEDFRAGALVESIATSFPFRHRFHPKPDS